MEKTKNKRWQRIEFNWQLVVNDHITLDLPVNNLNCDVLRRCFTLKIEETTPFDVMFWIVNLDKSSIITNFEEKFINKYVNLKLLNYSVSEGFHRVVLEYGSVENTLSEPSVTRF